MSLRDEVAELVSWKTAGRVLIAWVVAMATVVPTAFWVSDWVTGKQQEALLQAIRSQEASLDRGIQANERSFDRQTATITEALNRQSESLTTAMGSLQASIEALNRRLEGMQTGYVDVVAESRANKENIGSLTKDIDELKAGFAELNNVIRAGYENPAQWLQKIENWDQVMQALSVPAGRPVFLQLKMPGWPEE